MPIVTCFSLLKKNQLKQRQTKTKQNKTKKSNEQRKWVGSPVQWVPNRPRYHRMLIGRIRLTTEYICLRTRRGELMTSLSLFRQGRWLLIRLITPSSATKPGFGLRQVSFVFLRWRRFQRYLAPLSVTTSEGRVPTRLSTFAFTASLLEFPGDTIRTVSPLLCAPRSLAPPIECKDLSFLLSEKLLIGLGLDNWPETVRNDG